MQSSPKVKVVYFDQYASLVSAFLVIYFEIIQSFFVCGLCNALLSYVSVVYMQIYLGQDFT